jgi:ATP-dependent Clp protease ATP-binding subunit ClpA
MPAFSRNLEHTLRHAQVSASDRREERVTLEHLLLALTDDPDAAAIMRACGVDLGKLRDAVLWWLPEPKDGAGGDGPEPSADVEALLQRAVTHVTSAGRDVVPAPMFYCRFSTSPLLISCWNKA